MNGRVRTSALDTNETQIRIIHMIWVTGIIPAKPGITRVLSVERISSGTHKRRGRSSDEGRFSAHCVPNLANAV